MKWYKESTYAAEIPTLGDIFWGCSYLLLCAPCNLVAGLPVAGTPWLPAPEGNNMGS